jgi:hypothetical protein
MKPKKKKPRSEQTKRRISESLTGVKIGGRNSSINPEDGKQLREKVKRGDNFKYQELIDWYRSRGNL